MKLDIENKILIPFLMLIILPLLAVGIFFYQSSSNLFRDRLKDEMVKDLNEINNLVEKYQDQNPEDFINMVNDIKNNRVLLFNIKKDQLYSNNEISNIMKIQKEIINNINKEEDEFNFEIEGEDKKLFSFKKSKNENWYIGTERSLTPVTFSLLDIQKYTILVAIIFAIIAVEFTILLAHNISKPLKKLADFCKTISEGNYDHHIDINRSDEIGILANSFNNMVDKIHHSTEEIKKVKEINENILRSTSVGLISIDTMGEVITLNRAAEQILKQSSHRKKEIYNKLISFSRKALENKKRINESIDFFDKQIGRIVIEVNTTLLTDRKGKVNGALC
ncbi:MAG: HAMP domain-containing protein, partial [bacterium]